MRPAKFERDELWFSELISSHQHRITAFLRRRLDADGIEAAQDLAQETFMTAWQKRASMPADPVSWLYATASNHLRNHQRRQYTRRMWHDELTDDVWIQPDVSDSIDSRVDMLMALGRLDDRDRELLESRYLNELDADQIAGKLHITTGAARKRLTFATQRLRQQLNYFGTAPGSPPTVQIASTDRSTPDGDSSMEHVIRHAQRYWIRQHLESSYSSTESSPERRLSTLLATFVAETLCRNGTHISMPGDWGLDALLHDDTTQTLHIVQAKWINPGCSFGEADIIRAASLLREFVLQAGVRLEPLLGRHPKDLKIRVTVAISAYPPRLADVNALSGQYYSHLGLPEIAANVAVFDSASIYQRLPKPQSPTKRLKLKILNRWIESGEPPWVVLCTVSGDQVARWGRDLIVDLSDQSSSLPSQSELSLRHEPSRFWYLNNGLTITAKMLHQDPESPSSFTLEHAELINGAHIFRSILNVASMDPESVAKAQVAIRIVLPNEQLAKPNKINTYRE